MADTIEDLEKKLEASRAARLERQRADDDARKLRMLQEELHLVDIEATEGILDRDIKAIFSPKDGAMVVVRAPKQAVWSRFQKRVLETKGQLPSDKDIYEFVHATLVYPDKTALEKICESAPAMMASAANAAAELAGTAANGLLEK